MDKFTYLSNVNGSFIDDLYDQYKQDPQSLEKSWQRFFEGVEFAAQLSESNLATLRDKEAAVMKLINGYRDRGHLLAKTNPVRHRRFFKADLDLSHFNITDDDLDLEFEVGQQIRIGRATLREIISHLNETYCSSIASEYRYIPDSRIRMWLHEHMEPNANKPSFSEKEKKRILNKLAEVCGFENFLHVKYTGQKRFSLEGCESFVPALDQLFELGSELGVKEFVIGMAHRGRLNVLVNLFGKSFETMFSEFEGSTLAEHIEGDGDVKYHQGHSADIVTDSGHRVHLSLMANPSHLEAVDPVVLGSVWAKGVKLFNDDFRKIVPVLIHGDAAVAGQGVVYEIANLCRLEGYATGGTIHIVINNQVGFTANNRETRSSLYCTDIAKMIECPVFHVNADDVEAVAHAVSLAIKLRQEFAIDVFIDILGYRRFGHNEGDDPKFTQPLLYKSIGNHPTVLEIYSNRLIEEDVITEEDAEKIKKDFNQVLQKSLKDARDKKPVIETNYLGREWKHLRRATKDDFETSPETGVSKSILDKIAKGLATVPKEFSIYPKLRKLIDQRNNLYNVEKTVDWGLAEALAFGSLLVGGIAIRLSGQDSRRGTFAHRHSVLIDANDESNFIPLNQIQKKQERIHVYNSHLSEYGVLGFEYGYSLAMPNALAIWEAQFGDFSNGAQIIIDQFISSSESKWQRMSGLVMLLPHGYEGQGPEHSSARLGRYLELCADLNLIVVNPTTPANFFHLLRRQIIAPYRKPLVVMTPKSLLRHKLVRSDVSELENGQFQEIIDDNQVDKKKVKRVILCAGKLYYELLENKIEQKQHNTAIIRIEQFYPIPLKQDVQLIKMYEQVKEWVWVQEEPVNMGAWDFINKRFGQQCNLRVVSRPESASPASGSLIVHNAVQKQLISDAFK